MPIWIQKIIGKAMLVGVALIAAFGTLLAFFKSGEKKGKLKEQVKSTEKVISDEQERKRFEAKVKQADLSDVDRVGSSFMRDD